MSEKVEKSLSPVPSHEASKEGQMLDAQHDPIFGEITEEGPNYRSVRVI